MQSNNYKAMLSCETSEKIKRNLDADVFILESNEACIISVVGIHSDMQIEISELTSASTLKYDEGDRNSKIHLPHCNLTDALPSSPNLADCSKAFLLTTFDDSSNDLTDNFDSKDENGTTSMPNILQNGINAECRSNETAEIAHNTPSSDYPKAEKAIASNTAYLSLVPNKTLETISQPYSPNYRQPTLPSDDSREVKKTSGGALAAWQNAQSNPNLMSLNALSEIFAAPFYEAFNEMTQCGISLEIACQLMANTIPHYRSGSVKTSQLAMVALQGIFPELVKFEEDPLQSSKSTRLAFIGATGVGKTTTIAKLAARIALRERRRVELITLDTLHIAAVEQLRTYAEIIGAGCHVVHSVIELDSTLRKMPARASVLIDTTGRNPHDPAEPSELSEYLRRRADIRKCLAIQATTGSGDAIATARRFDKYGVDCLTLTKMDETTRPGTVVEIAAQSRLPLVYLCTGQRVPEDLQLATPQSFAALILRGKNPFSVAA